LFVGERASESESNTTEYSSLEEIQFQHFNELMEQAEGVVRHRKYLQGGRGLVESQCHDEINTNPTRCAYHFNISSKHPGFFELGYITTNTFRYMYVQPETNGLRCGGKLYADVNALTAMFKKSPHDLYKRCQEAKAKHQAAIQKNEREKYQQQQLELQQQQQQLQQQQQQQQQLMYGGGAPAGSYGQPQPSNMQQPQYYGMQQPQQGQYAPQQQYRPPQQVYGNNGMPPPQQGGRYWQPPPGQGGY